MQWLEKPFKQTTLTCPKTAKQYNIRDDHKLLSRRCMLEYPEVQRKVHEELDQILGNSSPTFEDRGKLVYTEATIMEAMRLYGVLPYGVPRRALADIHYKGK